MPRLEKPNVKLYVYYTPVPTTLAVPELPAVIVGPCYKVVRDELLGVYAQAEVTYDYPGIESGTTVDTSTVEVYLQTQSDTYALPYTILDGYEGETLSGASTKWVLTFTHTSSDLDIRQGDQVTILEPIVPAYSANTFTISDISWASDVGFFTWTVTSSDDVYPSDSTSYTSPVFDLKICPPTIGADSVTVLSRSDGDIPSGNLYITYRAFDPTKIGFMQINSETGITEQLYGRDVLNPLGYAVGKAYDNAVTSIYAVGVASDDETGHSEARDTLELNEVYAICPLTQDETIKQAYKSHVEAMSVPEMKKERVVCLGTQDLVFYKDIITDLTCTVSDVGNGTALITNFGDSPLPLAGDYVTVSDEDHPAFDGRYRITVRTSDTLTVTANFGRNESAVAFKVERATTKVEKRDYQAAYAESFGTKRVNMVFPMELHDGDEILNSMYGAAALAGVISGVAPQVPLSNTSIAGFDGLKYSNEYFTETNLEYIAGGGNFILIQEAPGAPLVIRHQLTTDTTDLNTREISRVKNVDYVSKFLRLIMKPYLGRYNVTEELEALLRISFDAAFTFLKRQRVARAGSVIRSGVLTSLTSSTDTITAEVRVGIGYPFNIGIINLYIS